ncbi:MAG: helix-turn-helix domain-containing protein [Hyphomicrobiaceae bacterium]
MPIKAKKKSKADGGMDWAAFVAMTDDEVLHRAKSDPDARPMSEEKLAKMKRATPVRRVRFGLRLSQLEFAKAFHIPIDTLRAWERGDVELDAVALAYLSAIARAPDAIREALRRPDAA